MGSVLIGSIGVPAIFVVASPLSRQKMDFDAPYLRLVEFYAIHEGINTKILCVLLLTKPTTPTSMSMSMVNIQPHSTMTMMKWYDLPLGTKPTKRPVAS